MHASDLDFRVFHFDQLASSNIHAQELIKKGDLKHADVIWTDYQFNGKGQKEAKWNSNPSENLLFSFYLQLDLGADQLFQLNKMASLAIVDLLDRMSVPELAIKWPNDILASRCKICGILIENSLQGNRALHTLIGAGLNVNQEDFPVFGRPATSVRREVGGKLDREALFEKLLVHFKNRIKQLKEDRAQLDSDYDHLLYGKDQLMDFESEGSRFQAEIKEVDPSGSLIIKKGAELQSYNIKELRFLD